MEDGVVHGVHEQVGDVLAEYLERSVQILFIGVLFRLLRARASARGHGRAVQHIVVIIRSYLTQVCDDLGRRSIRGEES